MSVAKAALVLLTNPVFLIGFWVLFFWLVYRSPLLAWLVKVTLLTGWGAGTVGVTLYVAFAIYLPKRQYFAAIATVLAMGIVNFFWIVAGVPELKKLFRAVKGGIPLWDK